MAPPRQDVVELRPQPAPPTALPYPSRRRLSSPSDSGAAPREKCCKLPIRNPDFPSEHLAHQVFGLFGGSADAFDRFYQGRAVQAKRAETVGQS